MGFLKRLRHSFQIHKAGKEIAKSLGAGLTGSKRERVVYRQIAELYAEAVDAISRIQTACDPETRKSISRSLYELVLQTPRGFEGYQTLFNLDQQMREARDERHCGPWMARLLVLADHVCQRAEGDGLAASVLIAEMQGRMERFMGENGVRGWEIPIIEEERFDALRNSSPKCQHVDMMPVGECGGRGEVLRTAARALGIDAISLAAQSILVATASVSSAIMNRALHETGRDICRLRPQEQVAAAMGLWVTVDAVSQLINIKEWEIILLMAHSQLFLDCSESIKDPEAVGAALSLQFRVHSSAYSEFQKTSKGKTILLPMGQCISEFCKNGDVRYLKMLSNSAMSLAPFVQMGKSTAVVVI